MYDCDGNLVFTYDMNNLEQLQFLTNGSQIWNCSQQVVCPSSGTTSVWVTNTNESGAGSLRQAIACANASATLDTIKFNIPGTGTHTIQIDSSYQLYDAGIVIDGSSEPVGTIAVRPSAGFSANSPLLQLHGNNQGIFGLHLQNVGREIVRVAGDNCKIGAPGKANYFYKCAKGIVCTSAAQNTLIHSNTLGVDAAGATAGNAIAQQAILLQGDGNTVSNNTLRNCTGGAFAAIEVAGGDGNLLSQNSIFCNTGGGISLTSGGNAGIAAPTIGTATTAKIAGSGAPSNGTVEVFVHDATGCAGVPCQGKTYLGAATANGAGAWELNAPFAAAVSNGSQVTATGRNGANNTSGFATCATVSSSCVPFTANLSGDATICPGASASLTFNFTDGTAPYTVNWTGGTLTGVSNGQTEVVMPAASTAYSILSVSDANNCPATPGTGASVTVEDNTPPVAACLPSLTLNIGPSQSVTLAASDLDNGSTDNCGGALQFSFTANTGFNSRTYNCWELVGVDCHEYTLFVTDAAGNQATCSTTVAVSDPSGFCSIITGPTFSANHLQAANGESVCLSITTTGFEDIVSIQYSMHWDTDILEFTGVQAFGAPDMSASNFGTTLAPAGALTVSWFEQQFPFTSGVTLVDGTLLYQVCFTVIGTSGQVSDFTFDGCPAAIQVTNTGSEVILPGFNAGSVTVIGGNAPSCVNDSLSLVALYNATNGPGWTDNTNWLVPGQAVETWHGVVTNPATGCVQQLNLQENNLGGSLPDALTDLLELDTLNLYRNHIGGSLPVEIGKLENLVELNLDSNLLVGQIPASLGNCLKLTKLALFNNDLSGPLPGTLANLAELRILGLHKNELSGSIPGWLGSLAKLEVLTMDFNDLTGEIPKELGALQDLRWLALFENPLQGEIPAELGGCTNLEILNLQSCGLSGGIPDGLGQLAKLKNLRLFDNQLTGKFLLGWAAWPISIRLPCNKTN